MPIKFREFYYRELIKTKKEENESIKKSSNSNSRTSRR
jgi:hypothetical protein